MGFGACSVKVEGNTEAYWQILVNLLSLSLSLIHSQFYLLKKKTTTMLKTTLMQIKPSSRHYITPCSSKYNANLPTYPTLFCVLSLSMLWVYTCSRVPYPKSTKKQKIKHTRTLTHSNSLHPSLFSDLNFIIYSRYIPYFL